MVKRKMGKQDIIEELANQKKVEELIQNITKRTFFELEDLAQDIYIHLIDYDDNKIIQLYNNKQLIYFIVRIIYNNYFSKTSRYYYIYKKYLNNCTPIEDFYDTI